MVDRRTFIQSSYALPAVASGLVFPGRAGAFRETLAADRRMRIVYRGEHAAVENGMIRHSFTGLPPFRPTEITDAEIDDIAAYIKDSASR